MAPSAHVRLFKDNRKAVLFNRLTLQHSEITLDAAAEFARGEFQESYAQVLKTRPELVQKFFTSHEDERLRHAADLLHVNPPASRINSYRIVLLEQCNLACKYCFEASFPSKKRMTRDVLARVLEQLFIFHENEEFAIHWFGGEPLLAFDLLEFGVKLCDAAIAAGRIKRVHYNVTTHGGLVNTTNAAFLARNGFQTFVSIDGEEDINDLNRVDRSGKSTFRAAIRGFYMVRAAGGDVGFLFTPHSNTLPHLFHGIEAMHQKYRPTLFGINTPQPTEKGWDMDGALLADQLVRIAEYCGVHGLRLFAPIQRILRALVLCEPQLHDCRSPDGGMAVSISPEGKIGLCIVSWRDPLHLLELEQSRSLATDWKLKSHATQECRDCPAEMACGGPCALEAQLSGLDRQGRCGFFLRSIERVLLSA